MALATNQRTLPLPESAFPSVGATFGSMGVGEAVVLGELVVAGAAELVVAGVAVALGEAVVGTGVKSV